MTHAETIVVSRRGGWGDRLKRHRDGKEGGEGSGQGEGREGRGPLWGKGLKPREGMEDGEREETDAGRRAGVSSWANGRRWATDAPLCREMETTPGEREKVCILCRREGGDTPSVDGSG